MIKNEPFVLFNHSRVSSYNLGASLPEARVGSRSMGVSSSTVSPKIALLTFTVGVDSSTMTPK